MPVARSQPAARIVGWSGARQLMEREVPAVRVQGVHDAGAAWDVHRSIRDLPTMGGDARRGGVDVENRPEIDDLADVTIV